MNLAALFKKYGSDKFDHGFAPFYERFFRPVREEVKSVLEIGVADGASIRAWLDYFPNARIFGMDADATREDRYGNRGKWPQESDRFLAFEGDQANRGHLQRILEWGPWDIVIDDGGHTMEQQQVSLGVLFPHTHMFYVVEDLHTSFMDEITIYEGGKPVRSYPTGATLAPTTHELLEALIERKGIIGGGMSLDEGVALLKARPNINIFDRDGDHKHMTSVLEVR